MDQEAAKIPLGTLINSGLIKTEQPPSPLPLARIPAPPPLAAQSDPKDPEDLLKRCSGHNKKTRNRCSVAIGKKTQQNPHPTFLPTCSAHRDQQTHAGWCQFQQENGDKCGILFRWSPPNFQLCALHQGHHSLPCYFLKLPLELRHEIFRYLLPAGRIHSSTAALHGDSNKDQTRPGRNTGIYNTGNAFRSFIKPAFEVNHDTSDSIFPMPLLDLFLVNGQIYHEARDLLFSIATFIIDVRKDGTFLCGRRLLEPKRADGSSHFVADEADGAKEKFMKFFDWSAVKNYSVDILLENWAMPHPQMAANASWDEEVEIYDIRDYLLVVVSGVLAKSSNLCKLQVRVCLADFQWSREQVLANTKLLVGPFERLRNVRQPQISGVFVGRPYHNAMLSIQRPQRRRTNGPNTSPPICSVPSLPVSNSVLSHGMPDFDAFAAEWTHLISSTSSANIAKRPPIRAMFTEFKDFYTKLAAMIPTISYQTGRLAFLHRARVAREQEDVESFRRLRNEIIQHWNTYLDHEEQKKIDMNSRLSRMLDLDIYPCHEWDGMDTPDRRNSTATQGDSLSPVLLNADKMAKEGIPMTGNPRMGLQVSAQEMNNLQYMSFGDQTWLQHAPASHQANINQVINGSIQQPIQIGLPWGNNSNSGSNQLSSWQHLQQRQALVQQQQQQQQYLALLLHRRQRQQQQQSASILPLPSSSGSWNVFPQSPEANSNSTMSDGDKDAVSTKRSLYVTADVPGPSSKRPRVDSASATMDTQDEAESTEPEASSYDAMIWTSDHALVEPFVGKGKEKMVNREVICID